MVGLPRGGGKQPRWARHTLIFAGFAFAIGVALFVVKGIGWEPFAKPVDFGPLPWTLVAIAIYVFVGVNLITSARGASGESEGEEGQ